jgi:hypothetical protein
MPLLLVVLLLLLRVGSRSGLIRLCSVARIIVVILIVFALLIARVPNRSLRGWGRCG